jgi:hypothetical protein
MRASLAPALEPIIAMMTHGSALFHGIFPPFANLYVDTVVPIPELSLLVAIE